MPRRFLVGCTLTVSAALALGVAGGSGSYAPDQRSAHAAARASALRHQLRVERIRSERAFKRLVRPTVDGAIHLAAVTWGVDEWRMRRIIWRESRMRPWAKNPRSTASGLAQFLSGTWASTPQGAAGLSPFDPYANAMAMAWVVAHRGWGDWALTD